MGAAILKNNEQSIGRGKRGLSTKIHLATGIHGVVNCILSKGQRQDCVAITELWHQWNWRSIKVVVADKGYDSSSIRAKIKDHGAEPVIPRKGV